MSLEVLCRRRCCFPDAARARCQLFGCPVSLDVQEFARTLSAPVDSGPVRVIRHWPLCLAEVRVADDAGGRTITCPVCKKPWTVPLDDRQKAMKSAERATARAQQAKAAEAALDRAMKARRETAATQARLAAERRTTERIDCALCGRGELVRRAPYRFSGPVIVIGYLIVVPSVVLALFSLIGGLGLTGNEAAGVLGGFLGMNMMCSAVGFFISSLLGWFCIMKKKVLKCTACGAETAAG